MTDIKIEIPKFSFDEPKYDFGFIASALGMIPLPEGIALRPEAIVLIEDRVITDDEDALTSTETAPITLVHLSNQEVIELSADQMGALESFIRNAQKMLADAQREMALAQARNQAGNSDAARQFALKAGLIKPGR